MAIENIKIRARVVGAGVDVSTPYIMSFTVNRQRGQISNFSAQVKVNQDTVIQTGGNIKIYAGIYGDMPLVFTGIAKKATVSPCWDDPSYVIINISGVDILYKLENKKFTRRQIVQESSFCCIEGVSRRGLKSDKFKYSSEPIMLPTTDGDLKNAGVIDVTKLAYEDVGEPINKGDISNKVAMEVQIVAL
jgi:hypothetical protein